MQVKDANNMSRQLHSQLRPSTTEAGYGGLLSKANSSREVCHGREGGNQALPVVSSLVSHLDGTAVMCCRCSH